MHVTPVTNTSVDEHVCVKREQDTVLEPYLNDIYSLAKNTLYISGIMVDNTLTAQ